MGNNQSQKTFASPIKAKSPLRWRSPASQKAKRAAKHNPKSPKCTTTTTTSPTPTTTRTTATTDTPSSSQWLHVYSPTTTPIPSKFQASDFTIDDDKVLGEGSFAQVKIATHNKSGKKVAVKIFQKALLPEEMRSYATREPTVLSRLKHSNIVKLLHTEETDDKLFMYLQFMDGGDLHSHIAKQKYLEEKEACKIFAQLLEAVDYCHKNSVCHRDLKLENILLSKKGKVLLIDFGFAGTVQYDGFKFSDYPGSICYAAPELIAGMPYDGTKSDIYALGVTLYVMLNGRYPFFDDDQQKMYNLIWKSEPQYDSDLSFDCVDLISRMIAKHPKDRISIAEMKSHPWMQSNMPKSSSVKDRAYKIKSSVQKAVSPHAHKAKQQHHATTPTSPIKKKLIF